MIKPSRATSRLQAFPPLEQADEHGLLAIGGDLSAERLKLAYSSGVFPWYEDGQPILWWSPDPRCVLFPEQFKSSRSLRKTIKNRGYHCTLDKEFNQVIDYCAAPRSSQGGTWITSEMRHAYIHLYDLGIAHSVEVWQGRELIGGLYGVALGKVFFGESMFSRKVDASKVALQYLCESLTKQAYQLIDCQVASPHLFSLGAVEISRNAFIKIVNQALQETTPEQKWG